MNIPKSYSFAGSLVLLATSYLIPAPKSSSLADGGRSFPNPSGVARTITTNEELEFEGPFFESLGTNGRACVTCHQPAEGWSVSVAGIRERFEKSGGTDPIFRRNDGSNSPIADVSTVAARRLAYSMLLNHGLIRVERAIPIGAEFDLISVDDPYNYASAAGLSLFRRPLPSTNLRFVSTVMWDGREVDPTTPMTIGNPANHDILVASLSHQALDATNGHAEANHDITPEQRMAIVNFELGLATAQTNVHGLGSLTAAGGGGGPEAIADLPFYIGINDNVADPAGPFNQNSMTLFSSWASSSDPNRRSVARGQALFNSKPIVITGVRGLNDNPYFGSPASLTGTCTTCHNTPGVGNHSLAVALDIGLTDASRRTPDMPLYVLRNLATHELRSTTDPGLALSTGKWKDIGRFKGPILRGLAGRAPFFHNGSAQDLNAVLDFYALRFGVTFTTQEKADLVAFLKSL